MTENFKKPNYKQRMETLEKEQKNMTKEIPQGEVLCPFQSTPECEVACTPRCAIYRRNAKSHLYACPLTEIGSMAWNVKDINDRQRGGAQNYPRR